MTNAVNYTGLAPQLPQLPQARPRSDAEWQQFMGVLNTWQQLLFTLAADYQAGLTPASAIVTAKLTTAQGSMTFKNGRLTAQTQAT